jgi:hypothetical protein
MVMNVWNFLNPNDDHWVLRSNEEIDRVRRVLGSLKTEGDSNNYQCKMKKKGEWI